MGFGENWEKFPTGRTTNRSPQGCWEQGVGSSLPKKFLTHHFRGVKCHLGDTQGDPAPAQGQSRCQGRVKIPWGRRFFPVPITQQGHFPLETGIRVEFGWNSGGRARAGPGAPRGRRSGGVAEGTRTSIPTTGAWHRPGTRGTARGPPQDQIPRVGSRFLPLERPRTRLRFDFSAPNLSLPPSRGMVAPLRCRVTPKLSPGSFFRRPKPPEADASRGFRAAGAAEGRKQPK